MRLVPDAVSTYDIVLSERDKPSKVRGQGKSGKEMQLRAGAPLETIEHEFGHIFGDVDYYDEGRTLQAIVRLLFKKVLKTISWAVSSRAAEQPLTAGMLRE